MPSIRIIAFLLAAYGASCVYGQPRVIYVTDDLKKAAALKVSIDEFQESTTQLHFGKDSSKADASYVAFEILTPGALNGLTEVQLSSTFSASGGKPRTVRNKPCHACEVTSLFDDIVDQTLFGGDPPYYRSIYPPLVIEDCRVRDLEHVDVVVRPASGIGLEQRVLYGLKRADSPDESRLLLQSFASPEWDATRANLQLASYALTVWQALQETCGMSDVAKRKAGARAFLLVPHKVPPHGSGSTSSNAPTVTR
jgi:hypothetical protein